MNERIRSRLRGAVAVACLIVIVAVRNHPVVPAGAAIILVYVSSRSALQWVELLPLPRGACLMVRRVLRSAVYLPCLFTFPSPSFAPAWWALLAGVLAGAAGVALEWKEVRRWLQPVYLRLFPPVTPLERSRDIVHFALGGASQEYLYRYVVIVATAPLIGPFSILLAAALFVGEHLVQRSSGAWDRKDMALHAGLGLVLGSLAYGNGLLPALIGHTLYNAPNLLVAVRRPGVPRTAPLTTAT